MGDKKRKKASKNTDTNGESLQDSDRQIADEGDTPLVFANGEAGLNPSPPGRKRSRAISAVSMTSDDEFGEDQKEGFTGQKSTILHQLILNGEVEEVEKLLNKGTNVNHKDKSGKTPLHTAILSKQFRIVDRLLESGADVTITDEAGDTALHTAIHVGSEKLVLTLLEQGRADANALGRNSCTPLHLAAEMDNDNICKILIEHSGNPKSLDDDKMTPVAHAMERGAKNSSAFLLQHALGQGTAEDFLYDVDLDGSSLLHLAVNSGVLAVVELCVEYGVRIRQPRRLDKVTAFHMACELGSMPIVEYMVSKDPAVCRITLVDYRGMTPLHLAASKNQVHVVEFLLEKGAAVDPKSDERRTPLFRAADKGAADVVKLLMDRGADVTIRDTELQSVLHAAVGHPSAMEVLLLSPAVMSLITEKDVHGFSAVHYAAKKGDIKNLELLAAKNKTAASVTSDSLDTPIHVAAKYGWTEAVEKLMDRQNARILNLQNSHGRTPLHYACLEGNDITTAALLKLGATVERDQNDRSPLHLAALKGCAQCCEAILQKFDDCVNWTDKNKNTALHLAAMYGHAPVVTLLLSNVKSEITLNNTNDNILDAAVKEKRSAVVMAIAEHDRWKEILTNCTAGVVTMLQKLVEIMPDTVVRFLDQLVTESGDPASQNYKVTYDLGLIQGIFEETEGKGRKRTMDSGEKTPSKEEVNVISNKKKSSEDKQHLSSMALIETMAIHHRERCLTHPISFHLLNTKWKKFGWATFATNLFFYFLFITPLTTLAVYSRINQDELCGFNSSDQNEDKDNYNCTFSSVVVQVLNYFVLVMAAGHLLKEILSLFSQRMTYIEDVSNYLEWVCYITAILYCIPPCDCRAGFKQQVGAIALFFGWMNLILYFRRLSSYGQYVIMLSTMFVTLVKVLLLWMLFIMAFGTTFLMLMDEEPFDQFGTSLMTMFVMTLGELNYSDNFLDKELSFSTLSNVLFIVLVLGMPIIMMNMLTVQRKVKFDGTFFQQNHRHACHTRLAVSYPLLSCCVGLAVGDIDKIQQNALMDRYVLQVRLLVEIENSLPKFILKRVQVYSHTEFPNQRKTLKQVLVDGLIGFNKPEVAREEGQKDEISPQMLKVVDRIEKQDATIQKMFDILREQSELLKEIRPKILENSGKKEEKKEEGSLISKSLFGMTEKFGFS